MKRVEPGSGVITLDLFHSLAAAGMGERGGSHEGETVSPTCKQVLASSVLSLFLTSRPEKSKGQKRLSIQHWLKTRWEIDEPLLIWVHLLVECRQDRIASFRTESMRYEPQPTTVSFIKQHNGSDTSGSHHEIKTLIGSVLLMMIFCWKTNSTEMF